MSSTARSRCRARTGRLPARSSASYSEDSTASSEGRQEASTVAYSSDIGASLAKRMRWKRNTGVPGLERSVSDSSGVTVPAERCSQTLRGVRPRARMSSENEVSLEKFFSTRATRKCPSPGAGPTALR